MFHLIILPLLLVGGVQGGNRQDIQRTAPVSYVQPASAVLQADNESSDNTQPAMGYRVLEWPAVNGIKLR